MEAAAIVASILLAFGIDAWWTERLEKARTGQLLVELEAEWASELQRIEDRLVAYDKVVDALRIVLDAHLKDESQWTENDIRAMLQTTRWATYKPSLVAYSMVQAYGLDHVDDPELRFAIASWPARLSEIEPEQDALHDLALRQLRAEWARVSHDLELPWDDSDALETRVSGVDADSWARALIGDHQSMTAHRQLLSVMAQYRSQLMEVRNTLERNLDTLRSH